MIVSILALGLATLALVAVGRVLIGKTEDLARAWGWKASTVAVTLAALATSLPEFGVTITSSLSGVGEMAVGNALGSNIANLSLILGVTALVGKSLHFNSNGGGNKQVLPIVISWLPILLLADGKLGRIDGTLLVLSYIGFWRWSVGRVDSPSEIGKNDESGKIARVFLVFVGWIIALLVIAEVVVWQAKIIASGLNLSPMWVGLFLVAVGTSLPELVFSIAAVKKRMVEASVGDIAGSCAVNGNLLVGLAVLISPVSMSTNQYWLIGSEYLLVGLLALYFMRSKHRLDWQEGLVMVALFGYYAMLGLGM